MDRMLHTLDLDCGLLLEFGAVVVDICMKSGELLSSAQEVDLQLAMIADIQDPEVRNRERALLLHEIRQRRAEAKELYAPLTDTIKKATEQLMANHGNFKNMQFFAKPTVAEQEVVIVGDLGGEEKEGEGEGREE